MDIRHGTSPANSSKMQSARSKSVLKDKNVVRLNMQDRSRREYSHARVTLNALKRDSNVGGSKYQVPSTQVSDQLRRPLLRKVQVRCSAALSNR